MFYFVLTVGNTVTVGTSLVIPPLVIGATLMVVIFATGQISGGHLNPVVTLAVGRRGKLPTSDLPGCWGGQILGALTASFTMLFLKAHPAVVPMEFPRWRRKRSRERAEPERRLTPPPSRPVVPPAPAPGGLPPWWAAGAVAIFTAVGGWQGRAALFASPATRLGLTAALSTHADYGAGKPHALAGLAQALLRLPPDRPLLVFRAGDNEPAGVATDVVDYLAWPRPVEHVVLRPGVREKRSLAELRRTYAAVILCGPHAPADFPEVTRLGPGLEIVEGLAP